MGRKNTDTRIAVGEDLRYDASKSALRISQEQLKDILPSEMQIGGSHYKDCAIQPTEYIQRNDLGWCEGNAIKYITRHNKKGEGKKDIEKAIHYLELLLELEYNK